MPSSHRIARYTSRAPRYVQAFGYVLIATLMGTSCLHAATTSTNDAHSPVENIASLAKHAPMLTVAEGLFIMGTARHEIYSYTSA